ncbi:MAG: citrate synthase [Piscirickettsiaceae bacterium CG_4_9_14_3_um_filter_43_564]|nr:citrate synthase [Thiomicrospira sp.]OIP96311.1 MAG: citrate synthase [Thiomicrospira sp. CG2_30_44_34]PIQ04500.1 MAG: citrate synthase [Piscirickettsiaceae bacterium CG18_big_fil_WC_8_21_14_2_50_44_103]PIU38700.1 MAG: citrate synthase [Piscirickettsiaceae bacterium CG07_land_8_20_14_0_80_44_28]PIW58101.1 MAG: citrate synthase [Piscirickettsiaceae bacterium CG12_big_fil_rev_8_21_14_0_65_44_934]PIW78202.1 MAG: citrate synthase [Piscirickettsiaceae bacterium CG_4_8_14_3_um_filter_44_38]PIX78
MDYIPGLAGVPATESEISYIDGNKGELTYRGYNIMELAEYSSFEETTLLLLFGNLPNATELADFESKLRDARRVKYNLREIMKNLPATTHPMHMLQVAVASLASFYPSTEYMKGGTENQEYINEVTVNIISHMGTLVAMWEHMRNGYDPIEPRKDLTYAENFLYMVTGEQPDKDWARLLDACLILHAEHTINASTFTTMVTGSTLANPCSVISSAIASLSGPLHGGANQKVIEMLDEIGKPQNARAYIEKRLSEKKVIWGMGHREYKTKDPRATILQKLSSELLKNKSEQGSLSQAFETAKEVEHVCEALLSHKGVYPNVDFYSGILYKEMGFDSGLFTPIFAVARSAGWMAHWREQLQNNKIFRPTQIYKGAGNSCYLPMEKRGAGLSQAFSDQ